MMRRGFRETRRIEQFAEVDERDLCGENKLPVFPGQNPMSLQEAHDFLDALFLGSQNDLNGPVNDFGVPSDDFKCQDRAAKVQEFWDNLRKDTFKPNLNEIPLFVGEDNGLDEIPDEIGED